MKLKYILGALSVLSFGLISCGSNNDNSKTNTGSIPSNSESSSASKDESNNSSTKGESTYKNPDEETTIFLAGDSTVKTYDDNQYIGGWGQFLDDFLDDNITVKNCAQGGKSSRSFINEGRLYDIEGNTYSFSENGGHSIGDDIKEGDYLFIQFGHNDDDTKAGNTLADRMVPLGTPVDGIYPTTEGVKSNIVKDSSGNVVVSESVSATVQSKMSAYPDQLNDYVNKSLKYYGDSYYEYTSGGSYKWFLKQYIDFARDKGATPVLVTPVARVKFSGGSIIGGAGLHGEDFAYVKAVRQLAEEENCMLIDLFQDSKIMLETATSEMANYLMALKPNSLTGVWPQGYDTGEAANGFTGYEATHYNKFGAYLEAAKVAEHLLDFIGENKEYKNGEKIKFTNSVLTKPEEYVAHPNKMTKACANSLYDLFDKVEVRDPNYTYPDPGEVSQLFKSILSKYENSLDETNVNQAKEECDQALFNFNSLNVDDKSSVKFQSRFEALCSEIDDLLLSLRPKATQTIILDLTTNSISSALDVKESYTLGDFTIVGSSDYNVQINKTNGTYTFLNEKKTTNYVINLLGKADYSKGRYIEFTTTKSASITVVAQSTGSSARSLALVEANNTSNVIGTYPAGGGVEVTTIDNINAGSFKLGSTGSAVYVYAVIIEYFD